MSKIIVTGAAGYIGGQIALLLKDQGHEVIGIDQVACPVLLTAVFDEFHRDDFASGISLSGIKAAQPDAIIHCAGTSLVGPSIKNPQDYYNNNVVNTLKLLDLIVQDLPTTRIIFSSSAAVYGTPYMTPCHEVDPCEPISPYGESKLMIEMMLKSYHQAYNLDYVAFRYFNACGADSQGRHGQEPGATHIIARVLESLRDGTKFVLNGTDYETKDGTCVRDYVHVEDIAQAHLLAVTTQLPSDIYNLGSNLGTSNAEIVKAAMNITNKKLTFTTGDRRPGDPAVLTASADKFTQVSGTWRRYDINDIIRHAWAWYQQ
jgi:UDP-glucose 4-epimerase